MGGRDEEKWMLKVENQEMGVKAEEVNGDSVGLPLPRTSGEVKGQGREDAPLNPARRDVTDAISLSSLH